MHSNPSAFEKFQPVLLVSQKFADLSPIAEKVYLSTRRGGWVLSRVGPGGQPIDAYLMRRLSNLVFLYLPTIISSAIFETIVQGQFDHRMYGLQPNYRIFNAHPAVNDALPNRLISGTVILKSDIERFEEDGVVFKGEDEVCPLDQVILGTGYEMEFPFLDQQIFQIQENRPSNLYKLQYLPEQPHSLAFIGLIQPNGPLVWKSFNESSMKFIDLNQLVHCNERL